MMNCTVIADLLPLYIDDCCSKESAELVREHLAVCPRCQKLHESMTKENTTPIAAPAQAPAKKLRPLRQWQAAILQSILLFLSFALITVGVAQEAETSADGFINGCWALWLVVPATGFMLSLVNWYFVKLYKSRRRFWISSLLFTLLGILAAFLWTFFHYDYFVFLDRGSLSDTLESIYGFLYVFCGRGILLSAVLCALSGVLSNLYAKLLGKE